MKLKYNIKLCKNVSREAISDKNFYKKYNDRLIESGCKKESDKLIIQYVSKKFIKISHI